MDSRLCLLEPLAKAGVRCQKPAPSGDRTGVTPVLWEEASDTGPCPSLSVFPDADLSWVGQLPLYRSQVRGTRLWVPFETRLESVMGGRGSECMEGRCRRPGVFKDVVPWLCVCV